MKTARLSRDLDVFHDTIDAVDRSWDADRTMLERSGYAVRPTRQRPGYLEAVVSQDAHSVVMEWARDSAFRFFPLVEDEHLGLTLHPFDLATSKVLALVGRLEPRDWIDAIDCHERLQPLGYLAWAACGKDPGLPRPGFWNTPGGRRGYTDDEISALAFEGPAPAAADLSRRWRDALDTATPILAALPADHVGQAVCTRDGQLFIGGAPELNEAVASDAIQFHAGRIGGAWPSVKP